MRHAPRPLGPNACTDRRELRGPGGNRRARRWQATHRSIATRLPGHRAWQSPPRDSARLQEMPRCVPTHRKDRRFASSRLRPDSPLLHAPQRSPPAPCRGPLPAQEARAVPTPGLPRSACRPTAHDPDHPTGSDRRSQWCVQCAVIRATTSTPTNPSPRALAKDPAAIARDELPRPTAPGASPRRPTSPNSLR